MRIKTYLSLVCLYCSIMAGLNAQQTQYVGPDNGDWFTETNWNNGLPANGNDALIGGGINVAIGSPLNIDFTITNFGGINANAPVTNNGTVANSGSFNFSSSSGLINNGTFNNFSISVFAGPATFTNESGASFTNSGTFTLATILVNRGGVTNNGTIDAAMGTLVTEGTFDNAQTLTTESLTVAAGSTFTNNFGSNLFVTGASALFQVDGNFNNFGNVETTGTFNIIGNFANNVTVVNNGNLTISSTGVLNNAGGTLTNGGTIQNNGQIINGFQFINTGNVTNADIFTNNNLIDNQLGGSFTSEVGGNISMGFGSKIQNAGSFSTNGTFDSFGTIENAGDFTNGGTINNFSGSLLDNNAMFANDGVLNTNNQVFNNDTFNNNGTINVNGGSVWTNNSIFNNNITGELNVVQDFNNAATGNLNNNGRFVNNVRTLNEGNFTNNAYLENIGIYTNESTGLLTNNELFQQLSGIFQNKGSLVNSDFILSDDCSTISNDGSIDNNGTFEVRAIVIQRGTLSGTPVDCQGCYIHNNATSDAPSVCQNASFGADINGDVKVYAPELISFANFDSCQNVIYLANGVERPVFACTDIGSNISVNILVQIPNTNDSLTCTAIITPVDVLEPQFDACPKDIVVFTDQPSVAVDWTEPVFTDNCSPVSVTSSHVPGDSFPAGITGVTYTATDDYTNEGNCQFRVDVRQTPPGAGCGGDVTGPAFANCPADITLITPGTEANATWVAPTAVDDCLPLFINTDFIPGQTFLIGTTSVVYTATDGNGNESICEFDVTVSFDDPCSVDVTPPSFINCPANIYRPTNGSTGGAVAYWNEPNVFDLCGVANISVTHIPGTVFPEGVTNVIYNADDVAGNSGNCSFNITVGDDPCPDVNNGPLVNNCPTDFTVQANGNTAIVTWNDPTFFGSCSPITINSNYLPGATFQIGLTNVTYQASDPKGNTSTCSFNVLVESNCSSDLEPPAIANCPADILVASVNGSGTATWAEPTATDNCGLISFNATYSPGASFPSGVTPIVYTAADLSGNIATCEFNVNVVDAPGCTANASPIDLSTNIDPVSVNLSWNSALDANFYDIYLGLNNPPTTLVASNVNGTIAAVSNLHGGTTYYWYVVPKNVAGGATGCESTVTSFTTTGTNGGGGNCNLEALFIASSTSLNTSDATAKARLEAIGFNVTVIDDNQTNTSDADGKGLIFISSTTHSSYVNTKFRDVAIPVICYESYLFDDFKMTGTSAGNDYGAQGGVAQMVIENAGHPLAAGLSGTVSIMTNGETATWGRPSSSAVSIGSIPGNSNRKLLFAYDAGDAMVGMNAPARRVGFFLHNSTADEMTAQGVLLFDEAVKWAVGILPAGTTCNDGDPNTQNDVIQADGCTCSGTICTGTVDGISFFDLNTGSISPIEDGGVYYVNNLPASYNILASTSGDVESVYFEMSGATTDSHTENYLPYHYAGDHDPLSLTAGEYTIAIAVFTEDQTGGIQCDKKSFNFTLFEPQPENCSNGVDDDGDGLIDCDDPDCSSLGQTVYSRVNKSSDDAEESASGHISLGSSDLEMVYAGSNQTVGMRFENINIPQGAVITSAYIEFETDETNSSETNLKFKGEASDHAVTFINSSHNITSRPTTNAAVAWNNVPAWNTVSEKHQSPDLSPIIQEIVNRSGWNSGNSLAIIVDGTGERGAESYNGESANAPLLVVEYGECKNCDNVTDGGKISKNCSGEQITFGNDQQPSGDSGDVEYLWISGTLDCDAVNMTPVAGAGNAPELTISAVSETTYFIRCSRRTGCTDWDGESNCIIVEPADCQPNSTFLQTGKIVIEQTNSSTWYTITFNSPFEEAPIVILGPPSANSTEQVIPRVRNVTPAGFEFQMDEWNYLNGYHPTETLFYLAMTPGNHNINGVEIEAGSIIADESFSTYHFNLSFSSTPAVLTTVASDHDMNAVTPRTRSVSTNSFQFKVQEENNSSHADETIHYIAMTAGSFNHGGAGFKAGITSNSITHNWYPVNFGATFNDPGFLASFLTYDGGDVCALRHRNLTSSGVEIKVEEEKYFDSETNHTTEAVGWLVFSASTTLNLSASTEEELTLEGVKEEEHAVIYWMHNKGHEIIDYVLEKSIDGQNFDAIAIMQSTGSDQAELYENYDLSPVAGENLYRIKLIHLDGTVSYSTIVSIHYAEIIDFILFPNPANGFVKINLEDVVGMENVNVSIINSLGVLVQQTEIEKVYSKYYQLDIRNLKEGHYTVWLKMPGRKPVARQLMVGKI